ncbi:MAG TPA: DUF1232 domain-containing protein [Polyangiales bacterium]
MHNPPHLIPIHPAIPANGAGSSGRQGLAEAAQGADPVARALEQVPASNWAERIAKRVGIPKLLLMLRNRKAISSELRTIPRKMQLITNQARLVIDLVEDFRSGSYREVSWVSIAVAAACLVYVVSPGDVVPDAIPFLGTLDDMILVTLAMHFLEKDLRAYCRHKGYAESEYFA